jgi:hypothetical protein
MFETSTSAEIPFPAAFGPNIRLWDCVHLNLHIPWFHIEYETMADDGLLLRQMLFITRVIQLLELQQMPDSKIIKVDLVSPAYLNNQENWQMESLSEIWTGIDSTTEQATQVYVLKSGVRYVKSGVPEDALQDMQKIFIHNE